MEASPKTTVSPGRAEILLTGQATHADTIWTSARRTLTTIWKDLGSAVLLTTTRKLLTRFIMEKGIDHTPYMSCLDQATSAGLPAEKLTRRKKYAAPSAFSTHAFSSVTGIPLLCAKGGNKTANRLYV